MGSLVLEVQRDCLNREMPVSDVLRKALVIAKKLNLSDFVEWIELEIYGYKDKEVSKIPPYRIFQASIEVFNPYRGWQPVIFQNSKEASYYSKWPITESVSQVEEFSRGNPDGVIVQTFGPEVTARLMRSMDCPFVPKRRLAVAAMRGIVEAVRTDILQWCLRLEKDGIVGEGLTFSEQERVVADRNQYNTHFHIANMTQSQIQTATSASSQVVDLNTVAPDLVSCVLHKLHENINAINLNEEDRRQVEAQAVAIEAQLTAPKPNEVVIRESFRAIRSVLEGTVGSLIASGLIYEISRLFPG